MKNFFKLLLILLTACVFVACSTFTEAPKVDFKKYLDIHPKHLNTQR